MLRLADCSVSLLYLPNPVTRIYLRRTASEQQELVDKIVTW